MVAITQNQCPHKALLKERLLFCERFLNEMSGLELKSESLAYLHKNYNPHAFSHKISMYI